jgi:HAD superfamily hydrolase (TIGR01509 family)
MAGDNIVSLIGKLNLTKAQFTKHCLDEDTDLCLYPGVSKTLRALKDRGTPLGVVTNLPNWLVQALLKKSNLNSSFDTLVCAAGKPRPGGLARALSAMRRNADPDTFYVGDRPSDAEAAVNAGISFAWVSYGYGKKRPAGANVALAHFSEVLDL